MNTIEELQKIRKLVMIALFSDDDFLEIFVLKGGNVLDLAYKLTSRASIDVDVSMEDDFDENEIENIKEKLENALSKTFKEHKYIVFDFKFLKKPKEQNPYKDSFWGGYRVEFKLLGRDKYKALESDINNLRRNALAIGDGQNKIFSIDISKYEYCKGKKEYDIDNFTVYMYTPLMIVYEKLRAICQQMEEYRAIVHTNRKPRAKDFFDIFVIIEELITLDEFMDENNILMLKEIFLVKRVPLKFLNLIENYREFHRESFSSVKDSIYANYKLKEYDYYFNYVVEKIKLLNSPWEE